jgi:Flp pilus assembly protein TadG
MGPEDNMNTVTATRSRFFRRGNAVLEAALVVPILLSLTFGAVEYGYFFFIKNSLQGAAREGCRAAIVQTAVNSDVTKAVAASLKAAGLNSSTTTLDAKYTLTFSPSDVSTVTAGNSITITLDATWGTIGVRPMGLIGSSKTVRGTTVMRKEG